MAIDFRLAVFQAVAENLSFTKASHKMSISQPAVTRHIKELEVHLAVRLFRRLGNSIELTPEGRLLYQFANKVFYEYRLFQESLSQLQQREKGSLILGASTTISQYILPPVLARFHQRYPDIQLRLLEGNTAYVEQLLLDEKIDMGLIEGNSNHPQIHYENFIRDEIVLVASSGNPLFRDREITLAQLTELPLVLRETGSGTLSVILHALGKKEVKETDLKIQAEIGSIEGIKQYILYSDAAAFQSIHTVRNELSSGTLMVVDVKNLEIVRNFRIITLHGKSLFTSELFSRFLQISK